MALSDHSELPNGVDQDLGRALSSIAVGTETLREPLRLTPFEHWVGHIPFAFWLIKALRPRVLVELGTHRGNSYLAFCQAIAAENCATRAYAVDTWEGDTHMAREVGLFEELSAYHDPLYGHFSSLIRSRFDDARDLFLDQSIDLLHIDGTHTYDAVQEDFKSWESKLSDRAVVIFHDTNVRRSQYGVWKAWDELSRDRPHFEFFHSYGLGVLGVGNDFPEPLNSLFRLGKTDERASINIRAYFAARGVTSVYRLALHTNELLGQAAAARHETVVSDLKASVVASQTEAARLHETVVSDLQASIVASQTEAARLQALVEQENAVAVTIRDQVEQTRAESRDLVQIVERLRGSLAEAVERHVAASDDLAALRVQTKDQFDRSELESASSRKLFEDEIKALRDCLESDQEIIHDSQEAVATTTERLAALTYLFQNALAAKNAKMTSADTLIQDCIDEISRLRAVIDMLHCALIPSEDDKRARADAETALLKVGASRGWRLLEQIRKALGRPAYPLYHPNPNSIGRTTVEEIRRTGFFDDQYYIENNQDVIESGWDALEHFALHGWREGRKPNAAFDPAFYLAENPDVFASGDNPLLHYAEHGVFEGRPTLKTSKTFDVNQIEGHNDNSDNIDEEKEIKTLKETGLFDERFYCETYADVVASNQDAYRHFALTGWREGRRPNQYFDPVAYLARNPDVVQAGVNPLYHFASVGLIENRSFEPLDQSGARKNSLIRSALSKSRAPSSDPALSAKGGEPRWPVKMPDLFNLRDHRAAGRIAVVVHVYYPELWQEIQHAINAVPGRFGLFISLVEGKSDHLYDDIVEAFPTANVYVFANRGRDILPFMTFAMTGALTKYEFVCKIHTKRSPHRNDGNEWRRHLISSILSDEDRVREILATFDADSNLGMIVADGQIFESAETWVGNVGHLDNLAPLLGYSVENIAKLSFAGGSIFWMRAMLLSDLISLRLEPEAYEPEPVGIDGSLAHAVERLFSVVVHSAGMRIEQASLIPSVAHAVETIGPTPAMPRVVAFYLPQFHPIEENDRWWGRGFTEWTNVTKARPLFPGHRQPRLPGELGFTDLRLAETRIAQADLARQHGVSAFCYYHYWFGEGKKLLHRPLDEVLASGQPDFPFMICWANEPWSRNWDGANKEILVPQDYEDGWVASFAREVAPILTDPRYLRLDGPGGRRPMLMIYRIMHVPRPSEAMAQLRSELHDLGVGDVHLSAGWLRLGDDVDLPGKPELLGLDSFFEFPPHHVPVVAAPPGDLPSEMKGGGLYDYAATVNAALRKLQNERGVFDRHRSVMMGWDNTARRGAAAHIFRGATPAHFYRWLRGVVEEQQKRAPNAEERLIFVNAWNEWAEGTCLEPDRDFGRGWLEAVKQSLRFGG